MPKPKPKSIAPAAIAIDASSPDIVLFYLGGVTPRDVPARDLTGNDLARYVYRLTAAALRRSRSILVGAGEKRPEPSRPQPADAESLEELAAALVATGRFTRTNPAPADPALTGGPAA